MNLRLCLKDRLTLLRFGCMEGAVRMWMQYPRWVMFACVLGMWVGGLGLLWQVFQLLARSQGSGLLAVAILLCAIILFVCFLEPWLANTGLRFRARHLHKLRRTAHGDPMEYLRLLHGQVMAASPRARCHVSILGGQCPWLLAYGIEHVFDEAVRARMQALRLAVSTREAPKPSHVRQRL